MLSPVSSLAMLVKVGVGFGSVTALSGGLLTPIPEQNAVGRSSGATGWSHNVAAVERPVASARAPAGAAPTDLVCRHALGSTPIFSQLKFDTAGTIFDKISQLHDTDSVNTVSTTSVNGTARDAANHPTNPNGSSSSARHTSTLRSPHLPSSASGSCGDITAVELLTPAASSVAGHETDAGSSPITSVLPPGPLNPTEATQSSPGHLSELVKSDL